MWDKWVVLTKNDLPGGGLLNPVIILTTDCSGTGILSINLNTRVPSSIKLSSITWRLPLEVITPSTLVVVLIVEGKLLVS